jgi:hypothetical protein
VSAGVQVDCSSDDWQRINFSRVLKLFGKLLGNQRNNDSFDCTRALVI